MSYDPEKFSIGVIDLFSIFLPGAVLTYLVGDALGPRLLGEWYAARRRRGVARLPRRSLANLTSQGQQLWGTSHSYEVVLRSAERMRDLGVEGQLEGTELSEHP